MNQLDQHDLFLARSRLPKAVVTAMKSCTRGLGFTPFIAGGFIRGVVAKEELSDIDLFVPSEQAGRQLAFELREQGAGGRQVQTDNAITLYGGPLPIQIITRWTFEKPEDLIDSFDFTICQSAIWWDQVYEKDKGKWSSMVGDRFYRDLAAKRLVYTSPDRKEDAGGSMLRVLKYYRRGYTIPLSDMGKVIARLYKGINPEKCNMTDQEQVGMVIAGLLREVDPLIDPDHIIHEGAEDGEV